MKYIPVHTMTVSRKSIMAGYQYFLCMLVYMCNVLFVYIYEYEIYSTKQCVINVYWYVTL